MSAILFSWPVEKYGRFTPTRPPVFPGIDQASKKSTSSGNWQVHSFKNGECELSLLQGNHFMLKAGSNVLESFSLCDAHQWIRGAVRGDSLLFMCKADLTGVTRKFRVKFSSSNDQCPNEICKSCVDILGSFLPFKDVCPAAPDPARSNTQLLLDATCSQTSVAMDTVGAVMATDRPSVDGGEHASNPPIDMDTRFCAPSGSINPVAIETTTFNGVDGASVSDHISDMSQSGNVESSVKSVSIIPTAVPLSVSSSSVTSATVMTPGEILKGVMQGGRTLGRAYMECTIPTSHVRGFIRLCLTDQKFPAFVEAVEKELNNIA